MNNPVQAQHIETVLSVAGHYARQDEAETSDLIRKSWLRCVNDYGLDPARPKPARIVTPDKLREHQEQIEEFMLVARVGMEQMYKRVCGLDYVLLLTDANGIAVDYIGDDARQRELKSSGLYLGAEWSENYAGTCGVGTCLIERSLAGFRMHGLGRVALEVTADNASAVRLYQRLGFRRVRTVYKVVEPPAADTADAGAEWAEAALF